VSSLDEMVVFAAVVREGGFTAAARVLGVTKQTVSERIARLEARLEVQLLARSTRAIQLTQVGERYYESCAAIVAQAEEADRIAQSSHRQPVGRLRVTCPVGLAQMLLPVIAEYRRAHPRVRVDLVASEQLLDLIRDGIDVAVRPGTVRRSSSLIGRSLCEIDMVLVASPAVLAAHGEPATVEDLRALPCIAQRGQVVWTVGGGTIEVDPALTTNTFEAACQAALLDLGVAKVPSALVADDLRAGRLRLLFGQPLEKIRFSVVWPARRLPQKSRMFVDLLVRRAGAWAAGIGPHGDLRAA
jgi:DNA-binding transcriptional LysR family regulator